MLVVLVPKLSATKDEVVAHPSATVEFNQNLVPLNLTLQRFGAAKPRGDNFFNLLGMSAGGRELNSTDPVTSEFAPGQFTDLNNDQKMSAPAFQELPSGMRANGAALVKFSTPVKRDYGYQDHVIDSAAEEFRFFAKTVNYSLSAATALTLLGGSALGHSDLYKERSAALPTGNEIKVGGGGYRVVHTATMQPAVGIDASSSHIGAVKALGNLISSNPALAGKLMVVPEHELV
jgi:hypothetical protein